MKNLAVLLFCVTTCAWASKNTPTVPCKVIYTVVSKDALGNMTQGAPKNDMKWIEGDLRKKYPEVCYAPPNSSVKNVLFISIEKAMYHGTRTITTTSNTTGNVTDNSGNYGNYNGTTTSSQVVPQDFEYGKYMLTVEALDADSKVTVRHRFVQDGIYRTMYGIPLGGRGHHPAKALIEDAVKWIHAGGLNDALQSAQ